MGIQKNIGKHVNGRHIKALLWKDALVRMRQPWMTAIQYIWPCFIFVALYALRLKFQAVDVPDCQFPTRQLPSSTGLLPFFQSYICTIENACLNVNEYEEISSFEKAPITPIINIVQTFLNEDKLYHAIADLPDNMDFIGTVMSIATHPKFKVLESNIAVLMKGVNAHGSPLSGGFDITQLWSDDRTFSKSGKLICGKPFLRDNNIRFVKRVFYQKDYNGANKDEVDAMPTPYCKQLYLDVTGTNNGKITWNYIKPIIQGKVLYGPANEHTLEIMKNANGTMAAMENLQNLVRALDKTLHLLRVEGEFQRKFQNLVSLAQSPFVQGLIKSFNVDSSILDIIFDALQHDEQVLNIVGTIANILDCFSTDRFIPVNSERELEEKATELNKKKLFLAGIYFNNMNDVNSSERNYAYTLRMDTDNTPITLENRNRFWFPGPDANFELQMRYHRGFIQVQHMIDQGIVKTVMEKENMLLKQMWESTTTQAPTTTTEEPTTADATTTTTLDAPTTTEAMPVPTLPEITTTMPMPTSTAATPIETPKVNGTFSIREVAPTTIAHEITNATVVHPLKSNYTEPNDSPFSSDVGEGKADASSRNIPRLSVINNSTAVTQPKAHKLNITVHDPDTAHLNQMYQNISANIDQSRIDIKLNNDTIDDYLDFKDEEAAKPKTIESNEAESGEENNVRDKTLLRKKRSPQFDGLMGILGNVMSSNTAKATGPVFTGGFQMDDFQVYTKQIPYPKYRQDTFLTGLYLSQAVQLAFFFALIVQVSAAVRNRIWMRESGNSTLMKIMGLEKSSENIAWIVTTFLELCFIFLLCQSILYGGGILQTTSKPLLYMWLLIFGCCVISFCYMVSAFFSSASIGSVSAVILFLMTYMPYIVIIALGTTLSTFSKVLASLSISTAFCYAWHYIMRLELQGAPLNFSTAFGGSIATNDLKFGIVMIIFDMILYAAIGYLYERFTSDEYKFHKVPTKDMDIGIGGAIQNCSKTFGDDERPAIDNVSIVFRRDYITCLLGRNGAGKSTIIKLLTGQIAPTSGQVFLPQNLDRISGYEFKERIGLCPQNNVLIPNLTALDHLELYASIKMNDGSRGREIDRIVSNLHFGKHLYFYSQNLSGGFKRRLNVAIAFIASPNLVILDEPCSGVDTKARRNVWELISVLRKGRAVVLATHYLDEAEHLSDSVLILNEGKVVAEHDPDSLKDTFTQNFELKIKLFDTDKSKTIEDIKSLIENHAPSSTIGDVIGDQLNVTIPYRNELSEYINHMPLMRELEALECDKRIEHFRMISSNLEEIFHGLIQTPPTQDRYILDGSPENGNGAVLNIEESVSRKMTDARAGKEEQPQNQVMDVVKNLFLKRFLHFQRNYRLIICVLVLPTIFEIIAMGFMTLRPPGEYDINLPFSRKLYSNSTDFYSVEKDNYFGERVFHEANKHCRPFDVDEFGNSCTTFNSSENAFKWLLHTEHDYPEKRYGGLSFNASRYSVWYNNKGYHSMPVYLNELNSAILKKAVNNSAYSIKTNNYPLKMGEKELTQSSILQQVADAGISLILLVAFSLVVAGGSVYIVNERLNGEKLQQKLCNVSFGTYWGVAFTWDFIIYIIALLLAVVVFKYFDIPAYTAKDNLYGICLILLLFGFATIPMVHVVEKLFTDASLANMHILCMNIIIALVTIVTVILIDILGESDESERIRDFLNRAFLIFPQHALADALIELCKNHIVAEVFERYYINTYKSPVNSDLLLPHITALILVGIVFMILNFIIESGIYWKLHLKVKGAIQKRKSEYDMQNVTTLQQNSIGLSDSEKNDLYNKDIANDQYALRVENLSKVYNGDHQALNNVSFGLKSGECFGLLGANGAGKSTIFGILSGQLKQTSGTVEMINKSNGISYCPQTNALDHLLTVEEIIHFYAKLRQLSDIETFTLRTLHSFHLLPYKNVLVKNLSGGNRRKLSVAVTCFGRTSFVLMDEPTSDMDPITRALVYASIKQLLNEKRTVVLTSHTITEIDRVCNRIGVMRKGEMITVAPPQQLKAMYGNRYMVTVYYDHIEALTIERDIKKTINGMENMIIHNHCLQFIVKIKCSHYQNNDRVNADSGCSDGVLFSYLMDKLHLLTVGRGIVYTITECLLDKAFESVVEARSTLHSYSNGAYTQTETPT